MPYKKLKSGKYKATSGKMKGKVMSKAQIQAGEISKHDEVV